MAEDGPTRRAVLQAAGASAVLLATSSVAHAATEVTVPQYVLRRLKQVGCDVLFGVPGATCDPLFHAAHDGGELHILTTASDLDAGYAADGYARTKGISAVSLTYGVGMMGILPVVSGAFAERSPMVLISGGPSGKDLELEGEHGHLFSHSSGHMGADLRLFREVTAAAVRVDRADEVPAAVDELLATALAEQRPVYLEIAKHLWWASCAAPEGEVGPAARSSNKSASVVYEVRQVLSGATRPVVLVGAEVARYGLAEEVASFVAASGLPWASTYLGKGALSESVPGFLGVYRGKRSLTACREAVEGSDGLLMLGCVLGRQLRTIATEAGSGVRMVVGEGVARKVGTGGGPIDITLAAVTKALAAEPMPRSGSEPATVGTFAERRKGLSNQERQESGLTYDEALGAVARVVEARPHELLLMSDTSLSMYPAADVAVEEGGFLCNGVWNAIGFSVPASIGAAKGQSRRPLVVCGDGGFQMTSQALSTLSRHGLPSVVLVLDNGVYGIEQYLLDPKWHANGGEARDYLSLQRWKYAELAKAFGIRSSTGVSTRAELDAALDAALAQSGPAFIQVAVRTHDLPDEVG